MKQLLLTGFTPFLGEKVNPSQKIIEEFSFEQNLLLPVSYQRSFEMLRDYFGKHQITELVMFGQASGRKNICFERVALNWMDSEFPDEDGVQRLEMKIAPDGPDLYWNPYPLRDWQTKLKEMNLPVEISNSAGAYVCNALSYRMANWLETHRPFAKWIFIHVPCLPEQAKPGEPSMPLEVMTNTIEQILKLVKS